MLRWYYSVDASTILEITDRVLVPNEDAQGISVGAHAEEGSGWEGTIEVMDQAGSLVMLMHRRVYAVQDSAPAGSQVIGNWFISNLDVERADPFAGAARKWIVTLADENSLLSRRVFVGGDSSRPAETDIARVRWLLTTTELNTVDRDEALIDTAGAVPMDAVDYTGQTPEQVMSDVSQQSGKNYWIKYAEAAAVGGAIVSSSVANPTVITTTTAHGLTSGMSVVIAGHTGSTPTINGTRVVTVTGTTTFTIPVNVTVGGTGGTTTTIGRYALCYFNANSDLYPSAISLSNVAAEINGTTVFAISDDTRLSRAGGRGPTSGMYLPYDGGYVYQPDTTVGDTYVYRDVTAPAVNVKTAPKATARAKRLLAEIDEPDDETETEIIVQAAQINAAMHGMWLPLHATHLPNYTPAGSTPGYSVGTNTRIMRRQVRQLGPTTFGIRLWLTPMTAQCPSPTATGSFYPLGGSGNTPNPSGGNVHYMRAGLQEVYTVTPGAQGSWHFPQYGAGGVGTTDYAGDCTGNTIRLIVVGDGTMTVHTAEFGGTDKTLRADLYHRDGVAGILDSSQTFAAGTDITVTVSTHGQAFCTHYLSIGDVGPGCGSKFGFSGIDWVAG